MELVAGLESVAWLDWEGAVPNKPRLDSIRPPKGSKGLEELEAGTEAAATEEASCPQRSLIVV